MPLRTIFSFLLVLHASVVFSQEIKIDSTSARTLRIDPQSARGTTVSQLFDEVEFIPLETTSESLFGNISQLHIIDGHFVFMDYDTKAILIFTKEGKFRSKITSNKLSTEGNEKNKNEFWGYVIAEEDNQQLIQIQTEKYAYYFNLDGKEVKKKPTKTVRYPFQFKFSDKKTSIERYYQRIKGKDTASYQLAMAKNDTDTIGYFPIKMGDIWSAGDRIYKTENPDEYIYYNYYGYDLFKITPTKISLTYHLIFPAANTLPKDFISNPLYRNVDEYLSKNKDVYYGISNTYVLGDQLYLKMHSRNWDKSKKRSIIYNLKTSEITSLEDIEPDARSYFLPVTDAGAFYDFYNRGFNLYEGDYFYTSYSSLAMFTFKEQSEAKKATYPPVLANYFKTSNKKGNPVIVKLKPKKN